MFIDLNSGGLFTEKYPHLTAYMCVNCRGIDAFAPAEGKVRCATCLTNIPDSQGKSILETNEQFDSGARWVDGHTMLWSKTRPANSLACNKCLHFLFFAHAAGISCAKCKNVMKSDLLNALKGQPIGVKAMLTKEEHLGYCKGRAIEAIQRGDLNAAIEYLREAS